MSWLSSLFNPSNPAADAANQQMAMLQQQQQQQTAAVTAGDNAIQSAFAQFTPDYYSGVAKAYNDAYQPQLTNQYNTAKDQLVAQLAGNGTLQSSVGGNSLAQLQGTYNTQQSQIADQGQTAANNLKNTVSADETNLYNMNAAAANPSAAATQAQATSSALVAPQSYPTLSNVFASALSPVASATKAYYGSAAPAGPTASNPYGGNSGSVS